MFERDHGYVPPLVLRNNGSGAVADEILTPTVVEIADGLTPGQLRDRLRGERYMSEYTIAVYLLGIGRLEAGVSGVDQNDIGVDPGGFAGFDGVAGPGFKSPGESRAWLDTAELTRNNSVEVRPTAIGRTYGPYLDFGSIEDALDFDADRGLHRLLDPYGEPIRYYAGWPVNDPADPADRVRTSMAGVPPELLAEDGIEALLGEVAGGAADLGAAYSNWNNPVGVQPLTGAPYALLSAGQDRLFGEQVGDVDIDFNTNGVVDIPSLSEQQRVEFVEQIRNNLRFTP